MTITEHTRPYETLIRHNADGTIGAQHQTIAEIVKDGAVIAATINPPVEVQGAGLEAVLGQATVAAIADANRLTGELEVASDQIAQLKESIGQAQARIAELEALVPAESE